MKSALQTGSLLTSRAQRPLAVLVAQRPLAVLLARRLLKVLLAKNRLVMLLATLCASALCVSGLCGSALRAQSLPPLPVPPRPSIASSDAPPTPVNQPALPPMPLIPGTQLDRVVAIVNGDLVLDSDVDQEQRLAALLPDREAAGGESRDATGDESRDAAIERLINRNLILQQMKLQPGSGVSAAAVAKSLDAQRKTLPACKQFDCETPAGWGRFLATQGFTPASITQLWQQRMDVLSFINQRFGMGITITPAQIRAYYDDVLLKQYAAQHATPPPLNAIAGRIHQVLLQQQVTSLLDGWLTSLRAQGSVTVQHPGQGGQ